MRDLTLVIPAKNEKESLPSVLQELKPFNLEILIVLEESDKDTINSISNYDCRLVFQKNKGYGDALILGINEVNTKYFCIFNADGSFNPKEIITMYKNLTSNKIDFIFASRYERHCSSEDDTLITYIGNFIFTKIGNIFFNLKITDILYTFVIGNVECFKKLDIENKDFSFCVELPIKACKSGFTLTTSKSNERARIGGRKKVNALKDGFLILISMFKLFFKVKK
ncbi:glycosyltransferase family 2 protein [Pelagibacterales bacterium SAG-MED38]|nr:glycosyltransferase family 2 protein [Pelagibacterales bacterium SAG-MED38]